MFQFTEGERFILEECFALTIDQQGRDVLVGLTYEETVSLMEHKRDRRRATREERVALKALSDRHDMHRLQRLGESIAGSHNALEKAKAIDDPPEGV